MLPSIESGFVKLERFLSPIDWVPRVSEYSGDLRLLLGSVQIAAGVVFALYTATISVLKEDWNGFTQSWRGIAIALHGYTNIVRGVIACGSPLDNLALLLYDGFVGRFNYEGETVPTGVYPLNQSYV